MSDLSMIRFILLFNFFFSLFLYSPGQSLDQNANTDCERFQYIVDHFSSEQYKQYYPFIIYDRNYIEWNNNNAVQDFINKISKSEHSAVRILHIGDSHIHSDIFTGYVRKRLQMLFGNGGRGLVFPFCTAGTHATRDYKTTCTGTWTSSKATERVLLYDIGVTGVTARTNDVHATASIIFRPSVNKIPEKPVKITLFYLNDKHAFDVQVRSGKEVWEIDSVEKQSGAMYGSLNWSSDTLQISFSRSDTTQNFFEMYGLIIEDAEDQGVVYSSAGINGAALYHLVNQKLLGKHIELMNPDLLILDLGTNDIYRGTYDESVLYKLITAVIQKCRIAVPDACILLMPPQDMYYRKKHVVTTSAFSALLKKIAFEQRCLFWDYFAVSGSDYSMLKWEKNLLAKKDRLHLSTEGYELKGKLFVMALLDVIAEATLAGKLSAERIWEKPDSACMSLLFQEPAMYGGSVEPDSVKPESAVKSNQPSVPPSGGYNTHVVKSGESLGVIAQKYGVKVSQIQQWNNISGTTIYPGQKLKIYGKSAAVKPSGSDKKQTTTTSSSTSGKSKITYAVKSGDSLYAIAKNHGTTVENIKKWNNLTTDRIHPGQQLIIYK
jgi:LysM repeat protein/lysophospholipase L1-like esterase